MGFLIQFCEIDGDERSKLQNYFASDKGQEKNGEDKESSGAIYSAPSLSER